MYKVYTGYKLGGIKRWKEEWYSNRYFEKNELCLLNAQANISTINIFLKEQILLPDKPWS